MPASSTRLAGTSFVSCKLKLIWKFLCSLFGDDDGYDDDDDCSVFEAASRISPVQKNSSDDDYGPYWDNSPTCTPYLDHLSD